MPRLTTILLLLLLSACGTRGALTLPPGPPPEPLLGGPASPLKPYKNQKSPAIKPADSKAEDNSTPPKATAE